MNELSIAIRTIHFVSTLMLFGAFVFFIWVVKPVVPDMPDSWLTEQRTLHRRLWQIATGSLIAVIGSGILWLAMEAVLMSGLGVERALARETLGTVLNETLFGRLWKIRFGLAIALTVLLVSVRGRLKNCDRRIPAICLLFAGTLLATLAWSGHAAAGRGANHVIHLFADAVHLLAAGAWFGALVPLVLVLVCALRIPSSENAGFAVHATRRFSTLGVASMTVLVSGGVANSWYTVGSVNALFVTRYGQLLLLKLSLFAVVLVLAAINRLYLTPRLLIVSETAYGSSISPILRVLCRHAIIEMALGLAIMTIVGALGITVPASHMQHFLHHHSGM